MINKTWLSVTQKVLFTKTNYKSNFGLSLNAAKVKYISRYQLISKNCFDTKKHLQENISISKNFVFMKTIILQVYMFQSRLLSHTKSEANALESFIRGKSNIIHLVIPAVLQVTYLRIVYSGWQILFYSNSMTNINEYISNEHYSEVSHWTQPNSPGCNYT